ncbi:MAG: SDR family NAD(P)-dependent oxidoreductase, partial [Firmicutes bacterium]|nr:SDR family NAD(P)-dependent oxidoreductase [Bacillota bacterium]
MAKIALVTGASGGIGSACAKKLAAEGCKVIVHYYRHKEEAERIAMRIGGEAVQADLRSEAAVDALMDEVLGKYGRIDVLVNNAGISRVNQVQDVSNYEWDLL